MAESHKMMNGSAILLAMFGTSVVRALPGLLNIRDRMAERYPATLVRLAFTSALIRRAWRQRAADREFRAAHPAIPAEIFEISDPRTALAELLDQGHGPVVIQPVFIAPAGEYRELQSLIGEMNVPQAGEEPRRPGARLVLGPPALGPAPDGTGDNESHILAMARALADDVELARERNAALLYMGHGARRFDVDQAYQRFAGIMRRLYPGVLTVIGTVEGERPLDDALSRIRENSIRRVVLKPFMVVAGNHVRKDMLGPAPRGWKQLLERYGLTVEPVLRGLGEQDPFARIFVARTAEAADTAGIVLR